MPRRGPPEPIYEVTQPKGTGEAHPVLSPNDEFADFELWDLSNLGGNEATTSEMLPGSYARAALRAGWPWSSASGRTRSSSA